MWHRRGVRAGRRGVAQELSQLEAGGQEGSAGGRRQEGCESILSGVAG